MGSSYQEDPLYTAHRRNVEANSNLLNKIGTPSTEKLKPTHAPTKIVDVTDEPLVHSFFKKIIEGDTDKQEI
jgi:hypothetical protein